MLTEIVLLLRKGEQQLLDELQPIQAALKALDKKRNTKRTSGSLSNAILIILSANPDGMIRRHIIEELRTNGEKAKPQMVDYWLKRIATRKKDKGGHWVYMPKKEKQ